MANFGFIIDNRRCIGCHACTVACKSEHEVPVGVNRTWVKYIEKGEFPNSRRLFSVMRCNHCDNAPCVEICPVTALYRRADGIVDFDNRRCIGCKACMQACPYDALYIDPQTHTAAKCNYCAHRIDVGLEPACVNVCPTQAIVSGDLDDPNSRISILKSRQQVSARKTEKGTRPALFYIDGDADSLDPMATPVNDDFMWSSQHAGVGHFAGHRADEPEHALDRLGRLLSFGEDSQKLSSTVNRSSDKARQILSSFASQPRLAYDAPQKGILWGWQVSAYLWTKSIAAGACMVPLIAKMLSLVEPDRYLQLAAVVTSLIFLAITGGLLVWDLDKPARFLYVLLRPQWRSWLVRGAYIITVFAAMLTLYGALLLFDIGPTLRTLMGWPLIILAGLTAVYTAFLFAQAKGRDFWQSPVLPLHMLTHAIICGAAFLAPLTIGNRNDWAEFLRVVLIVAILLQLLSTAFELFSTHPTRASSSVADSIIGGRYSNLFWGWVIIAGSLVPLLLLWLAPTTLLPLSSVLLLFGVFAAQHIWVRAPQQIPLG